MYNRVFIIEPVRTDIDISQASNFGEVTYIFDTTSRRCSVFHHDKFGRELLKRLDELKFDPTYDCICVVGAMLSIVITCIAVAQTYESFDLLLFNSVEGCYVSRKFRKYDWQGDSNGKEDHTVKECNENVR